MAFFLKKKRKEENIQEIKNAVEGKKIPEKVEEKIEEEPKEEMIQEVEEKMSQPTEEILSEPLEKMPEEVEEKEELPTEEIETTTEPKEEIITEPVAEITEIEKASFAPLFIKLDRYKSVLDTINELKSTIISIKNSLDIQKQIENLRGENRQFLESAINKVDKKILSLDSEFLRPKGFEEEMPQPEIKTEGLQGALTDLKKQIEGLKEELKTIS